MKRLFALLAAVGALGLLGLAALAMVGLAAHRAVGPLPVALAITALLVLPVLGLARLMGQRAAATLLAANLWPALLLAGLPIFFPEERPLALATGLGVAVTAAGREVSPARTLAWAAALEGWLPLPASRVPPPMAAPLLDGPLPAPVPTSMDGAADQVVLPYDGAGHSLRVPVTVEGPDGTTVEVPMLFDTGASYTTLDGATLEAAGYRVAADAPEITFQTASGAASSPIVVVERLWIGGLEVSGVTTAVCDPCAEDGAQAGLVGLNVSGRFHIALDTARGELVLTPRQDDGWGVLDVCPWLEVTGRATRWADGRMEVTVEGTNESQRTVRDAVAAVACASARFEAALGTIPPGETRSVSLTLPGSADCRAFTVELDRARW